MRHDTSPIIRIGQVTLTSLVVVGCIWLTGRGLTSPPLATPTRAPESLGLIAFVGADPAAHIQVYSMQADGSHRTQLTSGPGYHCCPAWSPDGTRIAFWSFGQEPSAAGLYTMDATGSDTQQVTRGIEGMNTPSWSPDGKRVAFTIRIPAGGELNDDIAVVDLPTLRVDNLTRHPAHDTTPAWSPDGKRIAFASDRDGPAKQIYVMNADGTDPRRLTSETEAGEQPAWSPDGQRIAYTCYREGNSRVCVMDADGSHVAQLTRGEDFRTGYHPSWSPDNLRIVYRSMWKDSGNLYVMNADGSSPLRLTSAPEGEISALDLPVWQPELPK